MNNQDDIPLLSLVKDFATLACAIVIPAFLLLCTVGAFFFDKVPTVTEALTRLAYVACMWTAALFIMAFFVRRLMKS